MGFLNESIRSSSPLIRLILRWSPELKQTVSRNSARNVRGAPVFGSSPLNVAKEIAIRVLPKLEIHDGVDMLANILKELWPEIEQNLRRKSSVPHSEAILIGLSS
jgi:hypothetical protein